MYKHTLRSKVSGTNSILADNKLSTDMPAATAKVLGGKNFFTNIRHKIEDNLTPKITGRKLYRSRRSSRSMSVLTTCSGTSTQGKYTLNNHEINANQMEHKNIKDNKSLEHVDSDDEDISFTFSLNLSNQSLEDEIFKELEKAARDEQKLNGILQNFDQILAEYQDTSNVSLNSTQLANTEQTDMVIFSEINAAEPNENNEVINLSASSLARTFSTQSLNQLNLKSQHEVNTSTSFRYNTSWVLNQSTSSLNHISRIPVSNSKKLHSPRNSFCIDDAVLLKCITLKKQQSFKCNGNGSGNNNNNVNINGNGNGILLTEKLNSNSDKLLVKCLAKGQDILRKVETINAGGNKQIVEKITYPKSNNATLKKHTKHQQLKYANEEKLPTCQMQSCKIIPPVLGETSDKYKNLLVKVVTNADSRIRKSLLRQQSKQNKTTTTSKKCENIAQDTQHMHDLLESDDSQDSGHISNENENYIDNEHKTMLTKTTDNTINIPYIRAQNTTATTTDLDIKCIAYKVVDIEAMPYIKTQLEIYPTYTKEILFRSGVLSELEGKRDILLSDRIIQLQAYCRGYLARKQIAQRRVQELAVRCIQRNVKAFLAVRDWPWWRLLVRVTPLLNVHRTEEQLKRANEELIQLRSKFEKIENDRSQLRIENQKLEAKLSEMAVDLAEERSTAHMATERLESETSERLKLEKELGEQQMKIKNLQESTEKLEMELICAKSDLNGVSEEEDAENDEEVGGNGIYKLKYERVARELEFTKRRLQTQHEHDLEQLVGLKKQLEKKLADAYEEVEEQRQVVGQWKRKSQKMANEMNDLRMLLEEQNARNNLLEKKQRKFDTECQTLQDAARQERQSKERLTREKDILSTEKFSLEQALADARLDLDLKEEKLSSLQRELEEITYGGCTEDEIAQLRRSKNELERRVKDQDEELDEMAGQVQLLEQAKLRLEMSLETMRKEARREAQQRDDELEEARGNAYKKLKALECQLETEHEERTLLLREKHELERRLSSIEDRDRADREAEDSLNQKLRRDLRKYKALLKDAQTQLDRQKTDTPGKALIRQLRNQLEDAESARTLAMKARQTAEAELSEAQAMFEESNRARNEAEDRANSAHRDKAELQAQIEENEEELAELMKKYSIVVKQLNTEQIAVSEYEFKLSELETERDNFKEQVNELQHRLENIENMGDPSAALLSKRLELRTKELESRFELEHATRVRLEVQINRHKEALEKVQNELAQSKMRELQTQEALKKSQKSLRELREENHLVSGREQESLLRRKDLEKKIEQMEAEGTALKNDLRLALQRIADLQHAMEEEGEDDLSESNESLSSVGSLSDLEERLRPIHVKRNSNQPTNGETTVSTTRTLVCEKDDNSPRITVTSPSSPHIHKLAFAVKGVANSNTRSQDCDD